MNEMQITSEIHLLDVVAPTEDVAEHKLEQGRLER